VLDDSGGTCHDIPLPPRSAYYHGPCGNMPWRRGSLRTWIDEGAGERGGRNDTYPGSCPRRLTRTACWQALIDQLQEFEIHTVELSAGDDPHRLGDMHDELMWSGRPSRRGLGMLPLGGTWHGQDGYAIVCELERVLCNYCSPDVAAWASGRLEHQSLISLRQPFRGGCLACDPEHVYRLHEGRRDPGFSSASYGQPNRSSAFARLVAFPLSGHSPASLRNPYAP
jgi:hypothetical protein